MPSFFDPRMLGPLIGGGLNPQSGGAFMRGWARAQQEFEQRQQREQQGARQTRLDEQAATREQRLADVQQQELMLRADAAERAREQQRLTAANSIRQLLEDPTIEDQATFEQRLAFAQQYGQQLGLEPGFIASLRPAPTVFEQRQAKSVVREIESDPQIRKLMEAGEDIGSQIFEKKGQRRSLNEWRALAQAATPVGALPRPTRPDVPNTPEEQFYQQYAAERGKQSFSELRTSEQTKARQLWTEAGRQGEVAGDALSLSGSGLDMAAKMYALTGQLPPMGMGRAGAEARGRIINRAAQYNAATGDFTGTTPPDLATNQADYRANAQALTQITRNLNAVEAFEATAEENSRLLEGMLARLPDQGATFLNRPVRSLAGALGSEDVAAFNALRLSLQNEYARLISNPNLVGVLSDSARHEMEQVLGPNATVGQIRRTLQTLRAEAANRREAFRAQRDSIRQELGGQPPAAAAPRASVKVGSIVRDKAGQRARVKGFTPEGKAILEPIN